MVGRNPMIYLIPTKSPKVTFVLHYGKVSPAYLCEYSNRAFKSNRCKLPYSFTMEYRKFYRKTYVRSFPIWCTVCSSHVGISETPVNASI